ncbi:unnamed protein product [Albugo candida]|nr:unnamed protein product [Albugo candida]|eukprot:CCI11601.1 unnamed protein product [Albugo candida]
MPKATFSFGYGDGLYRSATRSDLLLMYADITDDIPHEYVDRSCNYNGVACYRTKDLKQNVAENKKLASILQELSRSLQNGVILLFGINLAADKSRSGNSGASKRSRLIDSDLNHDTEKDQSGDASTYPQNAFNAVRLSEHDIEQRETQCLLFKNFLPEFSFLVCLQCLNLGDTDERYLVSSTPHSGHQWVLRYTSSEIPERTLQKCGSLCGDIAFRSSDHCIAAHIEYITGAFRTSVVSEYPVLVVNYQKLCKKHCLECVGTIMDSIGAHNGKNDMEAIFVASESILKSKWDSLFNTCKNSEHCSAIEVQTFSWTPTLSKSQRLNPPSDKSGDSFSRQSTTSYFCMHITTRPHFDIRGCLTCLTKSKLYKSEGNEPQKTSDATYLMFSTKALHVQELAIECYESCSWVAGLSKPVCDFLQEMDKVHRAHSTESLQLQRGQPFVNMIKSLQAGPFLWYLQFEKGDADMAIAFRELAFCIAVVTNAYVVSVTSRYLIVSPFQYEHVVSICKIPDKIQITKLDYVDSGSFSQPLSFQSITLSLGFSGRHEPENLKTTRVGNEKLTPPASTSTYG